MNRADAVFAALADPTRRSLLETLSREETVTASRLAIELPISRQAVAKHLGALREAHLVSSERVGRETLYRLHPEPLGEVADLDQHRRRPMGPPPRRARARAAALRRPARRRAGQRGR